MTHQRWHHDLEIVCGVCEAYGPDVDYIILWANQYGREIRIFCHECGCMTDKKIVKGQLGFPETTDYVFLDMPLLPWQRHLNYEKRRELGLRDIPKTPA
jgi:hypothetical protein